MGRWRRRRNPITILILLLLAILILFSFVFWVLERNLRSTILTYAEAKAKVLAVDVINNADIQVINKVRYEDLIYVQTDVNGRIVLMQPNTIRINQISSATIAQIQNAFDEVEQLDIYIPSGQALGSKILAGWGPKITARIIPVGAVTSVIEDKFTEAGINQTRHQIFLVVNAEVRVVVPLVSSVVEVTNQIPIAETVIVGEVPTHYFNLNVGRY